MTSYVDAKEVRRGGGFTRSFMAALIAMVIMLAVIIPVGMASSASAQNMLDNWLCGNDLGGWTSAKPAKDALTDGSDTIMSEGGKYSAMDIYGSSIAWTTWNGANVGNDKKGVFDIDALQEMDGTKDDVQKVADGVHSAVGCITRFFDTGIANFFLFVSSLVVKFTSIFVTWAVNPSIICQDPANPSGGCINLVGIIGGTGGSDGGIIGTLYNGLYLGLASMVFVVVAGWMLWKGIVKGQIRNAWVGLGWAFLSFVLGVMVLTNPMLLAEAPMKASVMLGSCVIESINGRSCLATDTNSATQQEDGTANPNTLCLIDPSKDFGMTEHLAIDARMSTCKMWKAFVLEPWTEGQFGMNYESLEGKAGASYEQSDLITQSPGKDKAGTIWSNAAVSLKAASVNELCTGTDYKYYNIALYQLDLMTNVHDCAGTGGGAYHSSNRIKNNGAVYNDWYYMIYTMSQASKDSGKGKDNVSQSFTMWAGNAYTTRTALGVVAVIAAIFASTIIIPSSLQAIGYLFMGVILTVFAPMFMLVGIHPGTGKKMFLGWLELELSAVLKYFFLMLWIAMVVEIYGAILGSTTNAGMILIFVLAMTTTLKTYQPELLQIFGNVDLGGKKLSNKLGQKFSNAMHKAGGLGKAMAGGAMAGFVGGEGGLKNRFRSAGDMMKYQGMQQGKRMGGLIGNAFQSADRIYDQRRRDMVKKAEQQNSNAQSAADQAAVDATRATQSFTEMANKGLIGEDGQTIDYNDATEESINKIADDQKAAILAEGDNEQAYILGSQLEDEWQQSQEENLQKAFNKDDVSIDANGIMHASEGANNAAIEYARMQNQKRYDELNASSTKSYDASTGEYVKRFNTVEDEVAFNEARKALMDERTVNAHNEYEKYAGEQHREFMESRLQQAKASGKISADSNINTYDDLVSAGAAVKARLDDVDARRANSIEALGQSKVMNAAQARAEQTQAQATHIKTMNEQVTKRSAGAMWSGKEARRLEQRSQQIDASIANGHGLDDVNVMSISNGAARIRAIGDAAQGTVNVAKAAGQATAHAVQQAPQAFENIGNNLSGEYISTSGDDLGQHVGRVQATVRNIIDPGSVSFQQGTAGTQARAQAHVAKEAVINTATAAGAAAQQAASGAAASVKKTAHEAKETVVNVGTAAANTVPGKVAVAGAKAAAGAVAGSAHAAHMAGRAVNNVILHPVDNARQVMANMDEGKGVGEAVKGAVFDKGHHKVHKENKQREENRNNQTTSRALGGNYDPMKPHNPNLKPFGSNNRN